MKTKTRKQIEAYARLRRQLKSGVKTIKGGLKEPLTQKDRSRIKSEMNILESRVPQLKSISNEKQESK